MPTPKDRARSRHIALPVGQRRQVRGMLCKQVTANLLGIRTLQARFASGRRQSHLHEQTSPHKVKAFLNHFRNTVTCCEPGAAPPSIHLMRSSSTQSQSDPALKHGIS